MIEASEWNEKKLGFGLMRLPRRGVSIDIAQTSRMADLFLGAGCTYFDTAFVYPGSEAAAKKALVSRHPRDSYTLATKLFVPAAPTEKAAKKEFETSLQRTGAGYIDYYLLHTLTKSNYRKYEKFHLWEFVQEEKAKGNIRHYGFSFHDGPELLDRILTEHQDAEFVQLQINYADWEDPVVQSRANYEVARKHGKPIVVMEPVKGGALANPPAKVQEILRAADPKASFASWAIRFAASLDGVLSVLSGMSNVAQVEDNLSYMRDFRPLSDTEREAIRAAQAAFHRVNSIPCTACRYCTEGCPKRIPIPEIFAARNKQLIWGQLERGKQDYAELAAKGAKASDCIACGQCGSACPQHIQIIEQLKDCAAAMEQ